MNTTLSHSQKSAYVKEFYFRTINGLFWPRWILSKYIVGFEFDELILSISESQNNRVSIGLSELHSIDLPEVGIQKNTIYDCFIGSEKKPRIRFRTDQDGKAVILFASKHIIRPNQINIVESKWESHEPSASVSSNLIERVRGIFWSNR